MNGMLGECTIRPICFRFFAFAEILEFGLDFQVSEYFCGLKLPFRGTFWNSSLLRDLKTAFRNSEIACTFFRSQHSACIGRCAAGAMTSYVQDARSSSPRAHICGVRVRNLRTRHTQRARYIDTNWQGLT